MKRLKTLEDKFDEEENSDGNVEEILDILRKYEKATEEVRKSVNFAEDLEILRSTVSSMIEQGLWKNSSPNLRSDSFDA